MLTIILGHTASGTSYLIEHSNLKRVKEFTTRPKRFPEENDYYFFSEDEIKELKDMIFFKVDYKVIDENQEYYSYGLFTIDLKRAIESEEQYILRTNIETYEALKAKGLIPQLVILLECTNYDELYQRFLKRDDLNETVRRYFSDLNKLKELKTNKNIVKLESNEELLTNFMKLINKGEH